MQNLHTQRLSQKKPSRPVDAVLSDLDASTGAAFFHEYGRHVGGVPRSSLKGKETQNDEGKRTQANPNQTKHQTKTKTNNQKHTHPHLKVFPLYLGETCEKDCELTRGLNSR